jgi:hypothetical protein
MRRHHALMPLVDSNVWHHHAVMPPVDSNRHFHNPVETLIIIYRVLVLVLMLVLVLVVTLVYPRIRIYVCIYGGKAVIVNKTTVLHS